MVFFLRNCVSKAQLALTYRARLQSGSGSILGLCDVISRPQSPGLPLLGGLVKFIELGRLESHEYTFHLQNAVVEFKSFTAFPDNDKLG